MHTDEQIVAAIVERGSVTGAAEKLGAARSTIHRRLAKPSMRALLEQIRSDTRTEVALTLATAVGDAMSTLVALLGDADPRIRLRAASKLLDLVDDRRQGATESIPSQEPIERARQLARAHCTDDEIEATVAAELGAVFDVEEHHEQIVEARLHGQALLRERLFSGDEAALASWLSRQHLGMSTQGIDGEVRARIAELMRLPKSERHARLRRELERVSPAPTR